MVVVSYGAVRAIITHLHVVVLSVVVAVVVVVVVSCGRCCCCVVFFLLLLLSFHAQESESVDRTDPLTRLLALSNVCSSGSWCFSSCYCCGACCSSSVLVVVVCCFFVGISQLLFAIASHRRYSPGKHRPRPS